MKTDQINLNKKIVTTQIEIYATTAEEIIPRLN